MQVHAWEEVGCLSLRTIENQVLNFLHWLKNHWFKHVKSTPLWMDENASSSCLTLNLCKEYMHLKLLKKEIITALTTLPPG